MHPFLITFPTKFEGKIDPKSTQNQLERWNHNDEPKKHAGRKLGRQLAENLGDPDVPGGETRGGINLKGKS